ncbi:MAG: amidohydrolase [bacterium]|nr:amidohydrolase [bacterium]
MDRTIQADLTLLNANIYGYDKETDSLLIKNGKIELVGPESRLKSIPAKCSIDLDGKAVYPGFVASHDHFMMTCQIQDVIDCRTRVNESIADYLHRLKGLIGTPEKGKWIKCRGLSDFKFKENRFPSIEELDELAPHNPISILHSSLHSGVVNSLALKDFNIPLVSSQRGSENPDEIPRDRYGKSTGTLHENAMMPISFPSIQADFMAKEEHERMALVRKGSSYFASLGYTTICDPLVSSVDLGQYIKADQCGAIDQKVFIFPDAEAVEKLLSCGFTTGFGSEKTIIGPAKIIADGAIGGQTAAIKEPYIGTDNYGILYYKQRELDNMVNHLNKGGYQIAIHAIGDRTVEQVVNAYERIIDKQKGNFKRHRMEHGSVQKLDLIRKMAELDIPVSVQPHALVELGDGVIRSYGADRLPLFCPYRTLMEAGIKVAGSADAPIFELSAIKGMAASILRKTETGSDMTPEEALTPDQALEMYSVNGAYALGRETQFGMIEEGKDADLVVLLHPLSSLPAENWNESIHVELTIANGKIIYQN